MLREKQQSFDAAEHHKQTILKDEATFEINDYKERLDVNSVTYLYTKRIRDLKEAKIKEESARFELRRNRRRKNELAAAMRAASAG